MEVMKNGSKKKVVVAAQRQSARAMRPKGMSSLFREALTKDELALFSLKGIDKSEELEMMIRLSDIQIMKFMKMSREASEMSERAKRTLENEESDSKDALAEMKAAQETILKCNAEIERIKSQKIKCIEILMKLGGIGTEESEEGEAQITIKIGEEDF